MSQAATKPPLDAPKASRPTSSSKTFSQNRGPESLPPPPPKAPKAATPRLVVEEVFEAASSHSSDGTRRLPEDPAQWDDVIKPFKLYARTALHGLDKIHDWMQVGRYDKDELASGELALGAYLYESIGKFSASGMLLVWLGATEVPRGMEFANRLVKERKERVERGMGTLQRVTTPPPPKPGGT